MDRLEHDVLVLIVEKVPPSDLQNLRLVNKGWHSAVRDAQMELRPNPELLQEHHLLHLCTAFPQATVLDLSRCQQLTPGSLQALQALSCSLQTLGLRGCGWVNTAAVDHLEALSLLKYLDLSGCPLLEALPESLSCLHSLELLRLYNCESLNDVESISTLASLTELSVDACSKLHSLPEGLSCLTSLELLHAEGCDALEALPDGLTTLTEIKFIYLRRTPISSLLDGFDALASLDSLYLLDCVELQSLSDNFGHLASLRWLDISGCVGLEGLPASFSSLSSLEVRVIFYHKVHLVFFVACKIVK